MVRKLYHGFPVIVERPEFDCGKTCNDYGLGFYCADSLEFDAPSGLALDVRIYICTNFAVDCQSCGAIAGYRADDSSFSFMQDFINGTISCRQLNNAMRLGRLGQPVALKSKRTFQRIRFTGYEAADSKEVVRKEDAA